MASSYCWPREPLLSSLRIIQAATWRLLRSREWRAGPKCRKKVTANQVTLWPQWAGLVCWLVVTKCPLHGSTEFWVFICVDALIQPNESWDVEFPVLLSQSNRESWVVVFPTLMFLSNWVTFLFCFFSFFCLWSLRAVIIVFFCYINWNSDYFVQFVQKKELRINLSETYIYKKNLIFSLLFVQ